MILWNRKWQPIPVFLSRKVHEHRSLAGYSPWDRKESDTTEHACIIYHLLLQIIRCLRRLSEFTSLVHEKLFCWLSICSASCCKDKSDDFQALYMSELKQEIIWGKSNSLEEEMAIHSSIPAWRIPWTEEPGGVQFMGAHRIGHDWAPTHIHTTCWELGMASHSFLKKLKCIYLFFLLAMACGMQDTGS